MSRVRRRVLFGVLLVTITAAAAWVPITNARATGRTRGDIADALRGFHPRGFFTPPPGPSRLTITSSDPSSGVQPDFTPTVACEHVDRTSRTRTFVFGFTRTLGNEAQDFLAPPGGSNHFVFRVRRGAKLSVSGVEVANVGQPSDFPFFGTSATATEAHPHVFVVRTPMKAAPVWVVQSTNVAPGTNVFGTLVSFTETLEVFHPPACDRNAPRRSATVQFSQTPGVSWRAGASRNDDQGLLRAANIDFAITNMRTACSDGGVPLAPRVLFGFRDNSGKAPQIFPPANLVPIDPSRVVRTDHLHFGGTFVRTYERVRTVADPQVLVTVPVGRTVRGVAVTRVIADLWARCRFGGQVVTSATAAWVGGETPDPCIAVMTNEVTQTLVTFQGSDPCDLQGPNGGGIRFR